MIYKTYISWYETDSFADSFVFWEKISKIKFLKTHDISLKFINMKYLHNNNFQEMYKIKGFL